jgi:DNA-binding MarR family transcriptional regulator
VDSAAAGPSWTFLTNHARVLIMIARDPGIRLRDVAGACDVTERTVQGIVADLESAGYLTRKRFGRRNRYVVTPGTRFRHRAEADYEIAGLLTMMIGHFDQPTRTKHKDLDEGNGPSADG